MAKIRINKAKLNKSIKKAFVATIDELVDANNDAIESDIWQWDGITRRRNGEVVGSPRNIVDTGELLDSLVVSVSNNSCELEWQAEHALQVHEGATLRNGGEIPPRPWTKVAIESVELDEVFVEAFMNALGE